MYQPWTCRILRFSAGRAICSILRKRQQRHDEPDAGFLQRDCAVTLPKRRVVRGGDPMRRPRTGQLQPDFVTFVLASADFRGFRREKSNESGASRLARRCVVP